MTVTISEFYSLLITQRPKDHCFVNQLQKNEQSIKHHDAELPQHTAAQIQSEATMTVSLEKIPSGFFFPSSHPADFQRSIYLLPG